ncbi:hypothetical protein KR51_00010310 [Rubidibacter lacunae KORDI 51-2]|uniref:Uncharacterized protein n=1 Tax=Rubidibacter lacunae KORDI 51-2 TaxID=582515 RepID=U5DNX1_9CHRO|nr:hypothetical protein KR51_00010310 [Rubidibacter lacunae KORDI 51-2]
MLAPCGRSLFAIFECIRAGMILKRIGMIRNHMLLGLNEIACNKQRASLQLEKAKPCTYV